MKLNLSRTQLIIAGILLLLSLLLLAELIFAPWLLKSSWAASHYNTGRYGSAGKIYQELKSKQPEDKIATHNEAKSLYKEGDVSAAASTLKSLEKSGKDDPKLQYDLGNAAFRQNDYKQAAEHYKQAILMDPDDYDAKANYELALRKLNEKEQKPQPQDQNQQQKKEEQPDYDNILGALDQREALDRQQKQGTPERRTRNWW